MSMADLRSFEKGLSGEKPGIGDRLDGQADEVERGFRQHLLLGRQQEILNAELSAQTLSLVASQSQLAEQHLAAAKSFHSEQIEAVQDMTIVLQDGLRGVEDAITAGFEAVLPSLGQIEETLDEILKAIHSPSQTWAYEQYVMACRAMAGGHEDLALETIERAIHGFGHETGYQMDPDYHALKGQLLIRAAVKHQDPKLLDPALKSLVKAASFVSDRNARKAVQVLLLTARYALEIGAYDQALPMTARPVKLDPWSEEPAFVHGQVLAALGHPEEALASLEEARTKGGPEMVAKAALDHHYLKMGGRWRTYLSERVAEARSQAEGHFHSASKRLDILRRHLMGQEWLAPGNRSSFADEARQFETAATRLQAEFNSGTWLGYSAAGGLGPAVLQAFERLLNSIDNAAADRRIAATSNHEQGLKEAQADRDKPGTAYRAFSLSVCSTSPPLAGLTARRRAPASARRRRR